MTQERLKKFSLTISILLLSFILIFSSFSSASASTGFTGTYYDLPTTAKYSLFGGSSIVCNRYFSGGIPDTSWTRVLYNEFSTQFWGSTTFSYSQGYTQKNFNNDNYTTWARSGNAERIYQDGTVGGITQWFNYYRLLYVYDSINIVNHAVILPADSYTYYKHKLLIMCKDLPVSNSNFKGLTIDSYIVINYNGQKFTMTYTFNGENLSRQKYSIQDGGYYPCIPMSQFLPDLSSYAVEDNLYIDSLEISIHLDRESSNSVFYRSSSSEYFEFVIFLPITELFAVRYVEVNAKDFTDWVETAEANPFKNIFRSIESFLNFEFFPGFRFSYILMFGLGVILLATIKHFLH